MPFFIIELPALLASLTMQPPAAAQSHRCGTPPASVADCCVHLAAWDGAPATALSTHSSAHSPSADERTMSDVDDR
ncbi:MAG: hypothetical protein CMH85_03815 [Novosphingobium sp.]|jgi:hypothetical protein|nr:hypothetical protein [Novosphingobium sp.]|tara:strand:+ start:435 stop:662 length:228 start_codon:yes stop_codon:yes gene_type:complete